MACDLHPWLSVSLSDSQVSIIIKGRWWRDGHEPRMFESRKATKNFLHLLKILIANKLLKSKNKKSILTSSTGLKTKTQGDDRQSKSFDNAFELFCEALFPITGIAFQCCGTVAVLTDLHTVAKLFVSFKILSLKVTTQVS